MGSTPDEMVSLGPASTRPAENNCQHRARYLFWMFRRRQVLPVATPLVREVTVAMGLGAWWADGLSSRKPGAATRRGVQAVHCCQPAIVAGCTHGPKAERKRRNDGAAGIRLEDHQPYFRRMTGRESHLRQELAVQNAAGVMARTSATSFALYCGTSSLSLTRELSKMWAHSQ